MKIKHLKINLCCKWIGYKHFGLLSPTASAPCPVLGHVPLAAVTKNAGTQCPPPTCKPSMANLRIDGVSLEACLKEKLLQSIIRMKPFIWSSWSSMSTSKDSRIARRISMKEFLKTKHKKKRKKKIEPNQWWQLSSNLQIVSFAADEVCVKEGKSIFFCWNSFWKESYFRGVTKVLQIWSSHSSAWCDKFCSLVDKINRELNLFYSSGIPYNRF